LKELAGLPLHVQARAEKLVFEELHAGENPFELELLEHMKGYPGKYKIQIGQYRIGVSLKKMIDSLSVNELPMQGYL